MNNILNKEIHIEYGDSYQAKIAKKSLNVGMEFANKTRLLNVEDYRTAIYNEMLEKYDYGYSWYITKIILQFVVKQVLWWLAGKILQKKLDHSI